jgi:precorrin-2 dehydrogenase/sirohydrochlorin ferrochelatase
MYPVVLDLQNRACLLVGGGKVAFRKAESLLNAGARLTVVALDFIEEFRSLGREGKIDLHTRAYLSPEAGDYELVIAAASDRKVNESVSRDARAAGKLVNVVDVPGLCTFYVPAVVRRGALNIAVSTEGAFPALAKRIKSDLEARFSPRYENLLEKLSRFREQLHAAVPDAEIRQKRYKAVASSEALARYLAGDDSALEKELTL